VSTILSEGEACLRNVNSSTDKRAMYKVGHHNCLRVIGLDEEFSAGSEVIVGPEEVVLGAPAGGRDGLVGAGEGLLVEDGAVAAHEREVVGADKGADLVSQRHADVEDLAVVPDISIVAVGQVFAREALLQGLAKEVPGTGGQLVRHPGCSHVAHG